MKVDLSRVSLCDVNKAELLSFVVFELSIKDLEIVELLSPSFLRENLSFVVLLFTKVATMHTAKYCCEGKEESSY